MKAILKPELIQEAESDDPFILEESPKNQEGTRVELHGVSAPFLAVRVKKLNHLSALQQGAWRQICDYLLIGQSDGNDYAVFVELKKTLREEEKPREQLRRSLPLLEYLLSVCAVEYSSGKSNLTIRYVHIAERLNTRFAKQGGEIDRTGKFAQEKYKSIQVTTFVNTFLHFADLARG